MTKKALIVGINDYQKINDLKGCLNDVQNMRDFLKDYKEFKIENIRVLTDGRATKQNIINRLNWLVEGSKSGDVLVFHFSGHGSQIRDRNGDEISDSLDELLCPYDMNWDSNYILDDELEAIFNKVHKDTLVEIFLDCCHSGTGLREMQSHFALSKERFLPQPLDIMLRWQGIENVLNVYKMSCIVKANQILWSGCQDSQTSADAFIDGNYNGAFTFYLLKHLRENSNQSRKDLLVNLRNSLKNHGYSQIPQLEFYNSNVKKGTVFKP